MAPGFLSGALVNPGFELGTTTGWTTGYGTGNFQVIAVVNQGAAPNTNGQLNTVHEGFKACQLYSGDDVPDHLAYAGISQTVLVDPAAPYLSFWFAAVLTGLHAAELTTDAYAQIDVYSSTTTVFTRRFQYASSPLPLVDAGVFFYRHLPWTQFVVDLNSYVGSTVTLRLRAHGCKYGEHEATAYVDGFEMLPSLTPTPSFSETPTKSPTPSYSPTRSPTRTPSPTFSRSPTRSPTPSRTETFSFSPSPTASPTESGTPSGTLSPSPSETASASPTPTASPSPTDSPSLTLTRTASGTRSASPSASPSPTVSPPYTPTPSATLSASATASPSGSPTPSQSLTGTCSSSPTQSPSFTGTPTALPSFSPSPEPSATPEAFLLKPLPPNPEPSFGQGTWMPFFVSQPAEIRVRVFTVAGEELRRLSPQFFGSGYGERFWDGRNEAGIPAGSGVFIYRLEAQSAYGETKHVWSKCSVIR